jgi:uncharacterized protein (TIGR02145 family)
LLELSIFWQLRQAGLSSNLNWYSSSSAGAVGNNSYPTYCNKSGFSGLPGGYRTNDGADYDVGFVTHWWTSTESSTTGAYERVLGYQYSFLDNPRLSKNYGFSIRCIKD